MAGAGYFVRPADVLESHADTEGATLRTTTSAGPGLLRRGVLSALIIAVVAHATEGDAQAPVSPAVSVHAVQITGGPHAPFAAFNASARTLRDSLVALARAQVGRRYRLGGTTPERGFDCSGLVKYVMNALGTEVPRTALEQSRRGEEVARDTSRLRPGDLLTFGNGKRITHIGIYVGDGRFVHASSVAGRVVESPVNRPRAPLIKPWRGVRRVIASDSAATLPAAAATSIITASARPATR